jgi:ubiquinone/menaquinone biosynthesis C-methylase UbiE
MVATASKNAQELGFAQAVKFECANAEKLPFPDNHFDFVVSTLSMHHWFNPPACFREICRVLKKNGEAYIYDLRKDTPEDIDAQVQKKYGWLQAFLFLKIVRLHSALTMKEAEAILSSIDTGFSKKGVQAMGVLLRLQMVK